MLDAIQAKIPKLSFTYAADYAGCPYGDRDSADITERVLSLVDAVQSRKIHGMILVACNTASTLILDRLRNRYTMPVVGVVPAVKPAFERYPGGKILLLATPQTVEGDYLEGLVSKYSHGTDWNVMVVLNWFVWRKIFFPIGQMFLNLRRLWPHWINSHSML